MSTHKLTLVRGRADMIVDAVWCNTDAQQVSPPSSSSSLHLLSHTGTCPDKRRHKCYVDKCQVIPDTSFIHYMWNQTGVVVENCQSNGRSGPKVAILVATGYLERITRYCEIRWSSLLVLSPTVDKHYRLCNWKHPEAPRSFHLLTHDIV